MTPQHIVGIAGAIVCAVGVGSDVVTMLAAYRKDDVEANPVLVQLHITTPTRAVLFGTGVVVVGALLSYFTPYVGAAFAGGLGIAGIIQALKTRKIL